MAYRIDVYLVGVAVPLSHEVQHTDNVLTEFRTIQQQGLRRVTREGNLEWYPASRITEVIIIGPGLESHGLQAIYPEI